MKYYIKKYEEPYKPLNKNYPTEVMKHWWQGDDKKFRESVKNYDNYYGTILPEAEITASKTTPTKTSNWTSEHNVAEDNKKYEQAHYAESQKIASAVNNKMNEVGNAIGNTALIGGMTIPVLTTSPLIFAGGMLGGILGGKAADKVVDWSTDGNYNTWAYWLVDKADTKYINHNVAEMLNPGTLIGGAVGGFTKPAASLSRNAFLKTPKGKALLINYELAKNIRNTNLSPQEQSLKTYGIDNIKKYDYQLGYKTSGIGTKKVKLDSEHWVRDITNRKKPKMLGIRPDTKTIKYQKEVGHYDIENPEFINIQNKVLSLENYIPKKTWTLSNRPSFRFKGVSFDNTLYPSKIYNVEKVSKLVNQFGTYVSKNPTRYVIREKVSEIPITLYHKQGGSIHIKEKNKGKFTEAAKRAGKSVQEHARDVVNNPKATKLQKKRAQFALNAKKFKH